MIRRILNLPNPVLRQRSAPVADPRAPDIRLLITDMKETCRAADGIGLAAPQIGMSRQVVVINYPQGKPYALINPELVSTSAGTSALDEGCLSSPGTIVLVARPKKVTVRALDEQGEIREITATDLLAKILQHEIDHLDGVLIADYQTRQQTEDKRQKGI